MANFLEKICSDINIKVAYTQDNVTVLSTTTKNNVPTINVHSKFKDCSEELAKAIVEFYTDSENNIKNLKLILDYINKNLDSSNCKIKQPDSSFVRLVKKNLNPSSNNRQENSNDDSLEEYDISYMTMRNLAGDYIPLNPDQSITASSEDVIELDIVIDEN